MAATPPILPDALFAGKLRRAIAAFKVAQAENKLKAEDSVLDPDKPADAVALVKWHNHILDSVYCKTKCEDHQKKLEAEQKRIDDLAKERFDLFWS
jgi:hypothetical protein